MNLWPLNWKTYLLMSKCRPISFSLMSYSGYCFRNNLTFNTSWQVNTIMEQRTHLKGAFIKKYTPNTQFIQSIDPNRLRIFQTISHGLPFQTISNLYTCTDTDFFPLFGLGSEAHFMWFYRGRIDLDPLKAPPSRSAHGIL